MSTQMIRKLGWLAIWASFLSLLFYYSKGLMFAAGGEAVFDLPVYQIVEEISWRADLSLIIVALLALVIWQYAISRKLQAEGVPLVLAPWQTVVFMLIPLVDLYYIRRIVNQTYGGARFLGGWPDAHPMFPRLFAPIYILTMLMLYTRVAWGSLQLAILDGADISLGAPPLVENLTLFTVLDLTLYGLFMVYIFLASDNLDRSVSKQEGPAA